MPPQPGVESPVYGQERAKAPEFSCGGGFPPAPLFTGAPASAGFPGFESRGKFGASRGSGREESRR
jgi:hypothetical protein